MTIENPPNEREILQELASQNQVNIDNHAASAKDLRNSVQISPGQGEQEPNTNTVFVINNN